MLSTVGVTRACVRPQNACRRPLRSAQVFCSTSFPEFLPREIDEVEDEDCRNMARSLQRVPVRMDPSFAKRPVLTSYAKTNVEGSKEQSPLLLLHGFDSSCLEWRRLLPKLEELGIESYAVDVLGWGFTEREVEVVSSFSPAAKLDHIVGFIEQHIARPVTLVGASLGGSIAIDIALQRPDVVDKLVLVDAQGYIDGAAMTGQPRLLQQLGVQVLKSKPLRMFANKIAYSEPERWGTEDAMRIGRLHCLTRGWDEAMIGFMNSGGYHLSDKVKQVKQETLVLWGRDDKILDPRKYAARFLEDIPSSSLEWIDNCGHVPHLEQANTTAQVLAKFVSQVPAREVAT
uniref:AB hydrolase-1 domain-containing protein n=1 Tax=Hanusia phi TaxID=3032 RepID=A0A7S0E2Z4_9CRYP